MAQRFEESWRKTREYLLEACSRLPEFAEGVCGDELAQFHEFLEHNEFELALDALEVAVLKAAAVNGEGVGLRAFEFMLQAATNMGLEEHAARYRAAIAEIERDVEERWRKPPP